MGEPCSFARCPTEPQFSCLCRNIRICSTHLSQHFLEDSPFPHTVQPLNPETPPSEAIRTIRDRLHVASVAVNSMKNQTIEEIRNAVAKLQLTLNEFTEQTSRTFEERTAAIIERLSTSLEFFEGDIDSLYSLATSEGLGDDERVKRLIAAIANLMLKGLKSNSSSSKIIEFRTFGLQAYYPALYNESIPALVLDASVGDRPTKGFSISMELLTNEASIESLMSDFTQIYGASLQPLSGHILFTCENEAAAFASGNEISSALQQGGIKAVVHGSTVVVSNAIDESEVSQHMKSLIDESGWIIKYLSKQADSKIELSFAATVAELMSNAKHPFDVVKGISLTGQVNFMPEVLSFSQGNEALNVFQETIILGLSKLVNSRLHFRVNLPDLLIDFLKSITPIEEVKSFPNFINLYNGKLSSYLAGVFLRDRPTEMISLVVSFGELVFRMEIKPRTA